MPRAENVTPIATAVPKPEVKIPEVKVPPELMWISGNIQQILLQEKEHFYIVTVNDGKTTHNARFGDPYTGKTETLSANNPMYSLIQQAFFQKQSVYLGVRDFGYDPQAGIEKVIIDRVSVYHL